MFCESKKKTNKLFCINKKKKWATKLPNWTKLKLMSLTLKLYFQISSWIVGQWGWAQNSIPHTKPHTIHTLNDHMKRRNILLFVYACRLKEGLCQLIQLCVLLSRVSCETVTVSKWKLKIQIEDYRMLGQMKRMVRIKACVPYILCLCIVSRIGPSTPFRYQSKMCRSHEMQSKTRYRNRKNKTRFIYKIHIYIFCYKFEFINYITIVFVLFLYITGYIIFDKK